MALLNKLNIGKLKESAEEKLKEAQASLQSTGAEEWVNRAKEAAAIGAQKAKEATEEGAEALSGLANRLVSKNAAERPQSNLREYAALLWCLASADGVIAEAEQQKVDELVSTLDPTYSEYAAQVKEETSWHLAAAAAEFGKANAAKVHAQSILQGMELNQQEAKMLCWNLLVLAIMDEADQAELDLVRFVGQRANIDQSVVEELTSYACAVCEIDQARAAMNTSDRRLAAISPLLAEYDQRRNTIISAAQALVTD